MKKTGLVYYIPYKCYLLEYLIKYSQSIVKFKKIESKSVKYNLPFILKCALQYSEIEVTHLLTSHYSIFV